MAVLRAAGFVGAGVAVGAAFLAAGGAMVLLSSSKPSLGLASSSLTSSSVFDERGGAVSSIR